MAINSKSTKVEILSAYKEIEQQKKALELKIKQTIQQKPVVNPPISIPESASTPLKQQNILEIVNTIQSLSQIQGSFGGAVSNLSERLIVEATQLETVRDAITLAKQELERLHQLTEIDESTIDTLLEKYQVTAKNLAAEFELQQSGDRQEIESLEQAWRKEQQTHARSINLRNEDYCKSQHREQEEYQYNLDLERDLDESEYEQEQKLKQQKLAETRHVLEQKWQEKAAEISQQEQEYDLAAAQVAAFDEQLLAKTKQGTEEGRGIGAYQAKVKTDLRSKEIEGEKQNYQLKIDSLEQAIKHQGIRINKLSQQLDSSLQQVQDLAVKAIEGTSNRNSFEAVKAIALEQVKTSQKGK
jgi:hypothetical protein